MQKRLASGVESFRFKKSSLLKELLVIIEAKTAFKEGFGGRNWKANSRSCFFSRIWHV